MGNKQDNVFQNELDKVKGANIEEVIDEMKVHNPVQSLRLSIFEFFKNRLRYIEKDTALRNATEQALLAKIQGNELSVNQLMNLLSDVKQQSTIATDSVFSILKPVPNSNSILDANIDRREEEMPLGDLSKEENQAIQNLSMLLQQAQKVKEQKVGETVDDVEDIDYTVD